MATTEEELHNEALRLYNENINDIGEHFQSSNRCLIAVLRHDHDDLAWMNGEAKDKYVWVKGRKKTLVGVVRNAYINSYPLERQTEDVVLYWGRGNCDINSSMGELNKWNDQLVVLRAVIPNHKQTRTIPKVDQKTELNAQVANSSIEQNRHPLYPVNRQLTVPPQLSQDEEKNQGSPKSTPKKRQRTVSQQPEHMRTPPGSRIPDRSVPRLDVVSQAQPLTQPPPFEPKRESPAYREREESSQYEVREPENPFLDDELDKTVVSPVRGEHLRQLIEEAFPIRLEASIRAGVEVLTELETPLRQLEGSADATAFLQQIESVRKEAVQSRTVVGVVGNTGAGKSSVINAMLEEERLVPTNCMRACTAVVTELSYNHSKLDSSRYRAEIEFISHNEWRRELEILFREVFDDNGRLSQDTRDPDSQASIGYAKIKAVYNKYTKDMLAGASVEKLMSERSVASILGTTRKINERMPDAFYRRLQNYVDSKEKGDQKLNKNGKKIGFKKRNFEVWPLIKVVRIYVRSDALSTGAVIVDLPGVHDSNAARAAVAEGYMKQCTGLWIVAPITRAVDDKAAQKLLGDTFKRQLKYDGNYDAVTFICSKTDDISKMEATDSLQLGDKMDKIEDQLTALQRERKGLTAQLAEAKEKRSDYESVLQDVDDKLEVWDDLQERLENGETVLAPAEKMKRQKKRKRERSSISSRKKRRETESSDNEIEYISSDDDDVDATTPTDDHHDTIGPPLTETQIEEQIRDLKTMKKDARREKGSIDDQLRESQKRIRQIKGEEGALEDEANQLVVAGRNEYSRTAIRQDFAAGIRELDQENQEEDDPDNFNPEDDQRDYEKVARDLPVFCVSSRAYQKLSDRMQKDSDVSGFSEKDHTEIPQLQAHSKQLTEKGRAANCRRFLNSLSRLVSSLALWASDDGSGPKLNAQQYGSQERYLTRRLQDLDKALKKMVDSSIQDATQTLNERIFEKFAQATEVAAKDAMPTQEGWGANRLVGGLPWATYKATVRRGGVWQGSRGLRDFNTEMTTPVLTFLQNHWEKAFQRKIPRLLDVFSRSGKTLLKDFHAAIEKNCTEKGHGIARISMLSNQLRNYDHVFQDVSAAVVQQLNERQREINREFVPHVATSMQPAYDECIEESGPGSFKRMKSHMQRHVEASRVSMFENACQEVRSRLEGMCEDVRRQMLERADAVFQAMRRDYMSLVGGDQGPLLLPQGERAAKRELDEVISLIDEEFRKVLEADIETLREGGMIMTRVDTPGAEGTEPEGEDGDDGDVLGFEDDEDGDEDVGEEDAEDEEDEE